MLLDVNCLLAISWPNHQHHDLVTDWFHRHSPSGWLTCAVTELGFINPAFSTEHVTPPAAVHLLEKLKQHGKHSYLKSPSPTKLANLRSSSIQGHRQTTDSYLLSLAAISNTKFVTLDKRVTHLTFASENLLILE